MLATKSAYARVSSPLRPRKGRGKVAKISPVGCEECNEILSPAQYCETRFIMSNESDRGSHVVDLSLKYLISAVLGLIHVP
jgi:hypothetical protein